MDIKFVYLLLYVIVEYISVIYVTTHNDICVQAFWRRCDLPMGSFAIVGFFQVNIQAKTRNNAFVALPKNRFPSIASRNGTLKIRLQA